MKYAITSIKYTQKYASIYADSDLNLYALGPTPTRAPVSEEPRGNRALLNRICFSGKSSILI